MKTLCALITAAAFLICPTTAEAVNTVVGTVTEMEGQVTATDDTGKTRQLQAESEVFLNDKIATATGARVEILLNDNSEISQGENGEMIIDQYVYEDASKEDVNCALKCVKGLFRILTGKIVDMNPERFQVQTRMATIGIRGCELGFVAGEDDEDIYVFDLPEGHSVEVEQTTGGAGAKRRLTIRKAGTAISVSRRAALKERLFSADEKERFFKRALLRRALQRREAMRNNAEKPGEAAKPEAKLKRILRSKAGK